MYIYISLISFFNVSIPILRVDPDELSQLRRFFTKIFGKSPSVPRVSFPHGWTPRYALRKRWICESQGWIMAGAVHRCKRGGGEKKRGVRGARWLGRICETIIESVRARAYSRERRRRRKKGMGVECRGWGSLGTTLLVLLLSSAHGFTPNEFRTTT